MKTSYYAKTKDHPNAVSIALATPPWHPNIRTFKTLAPTYKILSQWKKSENGTGPKYSKENYERDYRKDVLDKLNASEVYAELGNDSILCCYEKSSDFCHRHIVAKWFEEKLNKSIAEIE